jgi:hypothetical protein
MKNARKGEYLEELDKKPRETRFETQIFLDTGEELQLYDTFVTEKDPNIPPEGESLHVSWIEDSNQCEVLEPVNKSSIGSDKPFTEFESPELMIDKKSKRYDKRTYNTEDGIKRVLTVSIVITVYTL